MTFAETLSRIQAENGETNYRLAKEIGVHQTSVKNWKSGANKPHPRHVLAIEKHYRLKKGTLLEVVKGNGETDG